MSRKQQKRRSENATSTKLVLASPRTYLDYIIIAHWWQVWKSHWT